MTDPALPIATALIQSFESCRLAPHLDTVASSAGRHIYDIGWGSLTMPDGSPVAANSRPITQAEADTMLADHIGAVLRSVRAMVHVEIGPHAAAALCSLAYNCGTDAVRNSTLMRDLNQGRFVDAARGFSAFVYAGRPARVVLGLVNRRNEEKAVFLSDETTSTDDLNARELARIQGASE